MHNKDVNLEMKRIADDMYDPNNMFMRKKLKKESPVIQEPTFKKEKKAFTYTRFIEYINVMPSNWIK